MDDTGSGPGPETLLDALPFPAHIEHAYTPRETARYGGGDHVVVERETRVGRILRAEGDALCRPRRRFWGLSRGGEDDVPSCRRCIEIAGRAIRRDAVGEDGPGARGPGPPQAAREP